MGVNRAAGLAPSGSLKPGTEVANGRLTLPRRRRGSGLATAQAVAVGVGRGPRRRAQPGSLLFSSPNTQPRCPWACRPQTLISLWFPNARKQGWGPSREVRVPCALAFTSQNRGASRWLSGNEPACTAGDSSLTPGSGRSPGGGYGNPTPVFLPGGVHGQRSLAGCHPWGCTRV